MKWLNVIKDKFASRAVKRTPFERPKFQADRFDFARQDADATVH
jgi:hypothetical protein